MGKRVGRGYRAQLPENSGFLVEIAMFRRVRRWTCGHPQKKRLQVVARIRMTSASGFRLISPRAGAHLWGKGARILTEINRLPHFGVKFPPNSAPQGGNPVYLTREGGELMQMGTTNLTPRLV